MPASTNIPKNLIFRSEIEKCFVLNKWDTREWFDLFSEFHKKILIIMLPLSINVSPMKGTFEEAVVCRCYSK